MIFPSEWGKVLEVGKEGGADLPYLLEDKRACVPEKKGRVDGVLSHAPALEIPTVLMRKIDSLILESCECRWIK